MHLLYFFNIHLNTHSLHNRFDIVMAYDHLHRYAWTFNSQLLQRNDLTLMPVLSEIQLNPSTEITIRNEKAGQSWW